MSTNDEMLRMVNDTLARVSITHERLSGHRQAVLNATRNVDRIALANDLDSIRQELATAKKLLWDLHGSLYQIQQRERPVGSRRSRQYTTRLSHVGLVHCYRIYSDRSVEWGMLKGGEFTPDLNSSQVTNPDKRRAIVADYIRFSRGMGQAFTREDL